MNKLIGSLLLFSLCFIACQKEVSYETGGGPSAGSLQSDATGECLPKTVYGIYEKGKALKADSNYIEVQINVLQPGAYVVSTDNPNGMKFSASGIFTNVGLNTVKLKGEGTPTTDGITNFVVTYDSTVCDVSVTVLPVGGAVPAVFTLDGAPGSCMNATVSGAYIKDTALTISNTVVIHVTVTTPGTYNITTETSNNIYFTGTGTLALGQQTITLTGHGTPLDASNPTNVPVKIMTPAGEISCSFQVIVTGPAAYTINCGTAAANGIYEERKALAGTNTVTLPVTVTTAGSYNITATINGMTFAGTGTLAAGSQTITLVGSGSPANPGTSNLSISTCNVPINVLPVDYYPRTAGSNWSYEFDGVATDSLLIVATNFPPKVIAGNPFAIFAGTTDATQGFDSAGYFRKSVGNYYRWSNLQNYLGFDDEQFAEFIFIKDDQPQGFKWTTAAYSGIITESGTPFNVSVRISFEILTKDGTVTVKGTPYPNTIVLKETYEVNVNNTGWQDGTPIYGYYQDSYSRNVGWILEKHFDETNAETTGKIEMRRYQVAP